MRNLVFSALLLLGSQNVYAEVVEDSGFIIETRLIDRQVEDAPTEWKPMGSSPSVKVPGAVPFEGNSNFDYWNAFADIIFKLIDTETNVSDAVEVIGGALPAQVTNWTRFFGGKRVTETYVKHVKSFLAKTTIVYIEYQLRYDTLVQASDRPGTFIQNVYVTPLKFEKDPFYNFYMDAVSYAPLNIGTLEAPAAGLTVDVNFQLKALWANRIVNDQFYLESDSLDVKATLQKLD